VAGIRADLKKVIDVATPTTKLILGMLAQDMTQVQIAAELGLTVKAVNRRLAHFRERPPRERTQARQLEEADPVERDPPLEPEGCGVKIPNLTSGLGFTGLANIVAGVIGMPGWAILTVALLSIVCATLVKLAEIFIPHESHDKVLCWDKILTYRERRHTSVPAKKRRPPRAVGATASQDANVIDLPRSGTTSERTPARSP
jgi:hypothetical protein